MEKVNNILLVAITRLGDLLQASSMISGLKKENPKSHICVLVEKNFSSICDGISGIDEIIILDLGMIYRALKRDRYNIIDAYKYLDKIVTDLKKRNFNMCLNIASSSYTAILLKLLNIKDSRGWTSDDEGSRVISNPWSMLFAAFIYHNNRDYNSINIVDIFNSMAGVKFHPHKLVYKVEDTEFSKRFLKENNLVNKNNLNSPLIAVQVGASQLKRQWSPKKFSKVCKLLIEKLNARIVFTGTKSETHLIKEVFSYYSSSSMLDASGKTSLSEVASLLQECDLLLTGDTGTMHLAVSVGTKVVSLFLASALFYETGPYSEGNIVLEPDISCYPCNPNYPCSMPDCHEMISEELIYFMIEKRLTLSDVQLENLKIPNEILKNSKTGVYISYFDEDNFLDFKRINSFETKNGINFIFYKACRDAYKALWKEEFSGIKIKIDLENVKNNLTENLDLIANINLIIELANKGLKEVNYLLSLIKDSTSEPKLLGEIISNIEKIDRSIEEVGLLEGSIGALSRMFIMEKQNMEKGDAYVLSLKTLTLYKTLIRRCEKFKSLFNYYYEFLNKKNLENNKLKIYNENLVGCKGSGCEFLR